MRHPSFALTPKPPVLGSLIPLVLTLVLSVCVPFAQAQTLQDETQLVIRHAGVGNAKIGLSVIDLDTGRELASHNPDVALIPASTMKLLTTGMATKVLGEDFQFRTELIVDESVSPPILIIRGDADPALGDPAIFIGEDPGLELDALMDSIANAIKAAGIGSFSQVVIDDRVLDRVYTHPAWPLDQLNRWYCAQVGGLNFHTNVINVYTQPFPGATPTYSLIPNAYWMQMQVKAKSNTNARSTAWVSRPSKSNSFTLHGNVSGQTEIPVAINEPPLFAGRVIAEALSRRGIAIGSSSSQPYKAVRLWQPGDGFVESRTIAAITTPLADVLKRINTKSHNMYAESLLKRAGHEVTTDSGSWENGAAVLRMSLSESLGAVALENTVISDGSGMSRLNRVSPTTLAKWIRHISRTDSWDEFVASLAMPGEGTLRSRFANGSLENNLAAKSGYLTGVYALAGVLEDPKTGRRIAFSIMLNDVKAGSTSRRAKPLIDDLVEEIDSYLTEVSAQPAMGG